MRCLFVFGNILFFDILILGPSVEEKQTNKQLVNFCCCCSNILFFEYNNYYSAETYKQFYLWLGACELSFTNYPEYPSSEKKIKKSRDGLKLFLT